MVSKGIITQPTTQCFAPSQVASLSHPRQLKNCQPHSRPHTHPSPILKFNLTFLFSRLGLYPHPLLPSCSSMTLCASSQSSSASDKPTFASPVFPNTNAGMAVTLVAIVVTTVVEMEKAAGSGRAELRGVVARRRRRDGKAVVERRI